MGKKRDLSIVKEFKDKLSKKLKVSKMILFGSRAKGKPTKESDFDIIIVSDNFKGIKSFKRVPMLYTYWKSSHPVDFLCYTKNEFNSLNKKITIVNQAVKTGIEL